MMANKPDTGGWQRAEDHSWDSCGNTIRQQCEKIVPGLKEQLEQIWKSKVVPVVGILGTPKQWEWIQ